MNINANRLDVLMRVNGLNCKELASRAGISAPLLSRIRARGSCSPTTARRLANVIGWGFIIRRSDRIDPETAERLMQEYEETVSKYSTAQTVPPEWLSRTELGNFELEVLDFISRPVPADWSRWSITMRSLHWSGKRPSEALVERDRVCAAEVWCEALHNPLEKMAGPDVRRINAIIAEAPGWNRAAKAVRFGPYGVRRGFIKCNKRQDLDNI